MQEMKTAGAYNIAQDEDTCVVFGMPNEAIKLGGVDRVLPLERIANEVVQRCG
jgi:two-component system, chemotaxis family, protein-glutamate methylesterase/glutaminase